jgi:ferrous iron transport protein A
MLGGIIMSKLSMRRMKENQSGIISAVKADGEMGRRIRDMGLVPGTHIKIQGRAPLYDPGYGIYTDASKQRSRPY